MPLLPGLQIPCPLHSDHVCIDEEDVFRCPTTGTRYVIAWGNGLIPLHS